ncbi:diaminopimelate epimerase [Gottfriedia luciferensis]|uniref:Diaminopimelate epimerase n=1 Tax=Gottfriedia luciferensis TaxID=178774 RepID=A0ABX2ZPH5_9BACI|nr:diaminopimelate epimerase [Gottfriedia luciferensis]ODG90387.1 diaminopimelate epimerase [Gottfriedia luciferensis]
MNSFRYTKMHGLGNNYIYVNMFEENLREEELSKLAVEVSNINTGIGSDGMILISPSEVADVKMRVFNNDGSEAKNCGNGLRCVAKYSYEHGIANNTSFKIETISTIVEATVHVENNIVNQVTVNMGKPIFRRSQIPMIGNDQEYAKDRILFEEKSYEFSAVSMGNPHAVFEVSDIKTAPLTTLGPIVEKHDLFPESVNVEFIECLPHNEINFVVWERGSGVTQACGTGACAATAAMIQEGKYKRDEPITVHLQGGDLQITWSTDGDIWMKGPAVTITEGIYYTQRGVK